VVSVTSATRSFRFTMRMCAHDPSFNLTDGLYPTQAVSAMLGLRTMSPIESTTDSFDFDLLLPRPTGGALLTNRDASQRCATFSVLEYSYKYTKGCSP